MIEFIPDFIIHYNRGKPFRSISEVPQEKLPEVLSQLNEDNSWGLKRFSDPEYLPKRFQVEKKIRDDFIYKGGKPELEQPIYFFLGNNPRFEEHKKNVGYKIDLADVPPDKISFTYGDSMFSMCENYRNKLGDEYLSRLCSQVYTLDELNTLYLVTQEVPQKLHIECQLWIKPSDDLFKRIS